MKACPKCGRELRSIVNMDSNAKAVMHAQRNLHLQPAEFVIDWSEAASDLEFQSLTVDEIRRCQQSQP